MLYLTCTMISSVDLAHYGVSCVKDWVSVDCGKINVPGSVFFVEGANHDCSRFPKKIKLDISRDSSTRQNIKPYFLRKIKGKEIKVSSAAILLDSLLRKVKILNAGIPKKVP